MLALLNLSTIRVIDPPNTKKTTLHYHPMRAWTTDFRSQQGVTYARREASSEITEIVSVVEQP